MLNKNRSHQFKAWKFSLVIPFLAFFLVAFNTHTVTQVNPGNIGSTPNQDNGDNNITKIRYTIDKTTTDEALKNISATLKKDYKVDLLFKDISRNAKGHITAIHSTFTMEGGSGTSSSSDTEGIKPFLFNLETDKEGKLISVGFEMLGHEDPTIPKLNGVQASDASKILEVRSSPFGDPLYIVDGVEYDLGSEPLGIDPKNVQSIDVIKKTEAIKQYGEKGKNGVINVITIKKSDSKGPNDVIHVLTSTDNGTDPNTQDKIPSTITITGYKASDLDPKPLIIVDGIEKAVSFNVNTISADNFENIRVLKDGEATQQFGEKGENGVIEITTKKTGWTVGYGVNMDDPNDLFDIGPFRQNGLEKAVIFVDGANKGRNYVPTMKYSEVESIGSYGPGKSTTDKFGRQGRNGVIEIITKKN